MNLDSIIIAPIITEKSQASQEIGKEIGENKKEIEFILRLHAKGKTVAEIADLTDISTENISQIIAQK